MLRIEVTKGRTDDAIRIVRADGSAADTRFPKKGPFPHDLVHAVVEDVLGLTRGFWGMIAEGRYPEEIQSLADAMGHSSAKKAHEPDPSIMELVQAERLVECFEAEIWGGPAGLDSLQSAADAGFAQSMVPRIELAETDVAEIRRRLAALQVEWMTLHEGGTLAFDWPA